MDRLRKLGNMENRITNLLHKVPGYTGYRNKEDRRDDDKRLRDTIASDIQTSVDRLTQYNADMAAERELSSLSRTESLVGNARLLADRIRTASYGYGGIFTDRKTDEAALAQLRQFDLGLQQEVTSLQDAVRTLTTTMPPQDDAVRAVSSEIDRLGALFDGRASVVNHGKPSRDEQVLALLDTEDNTAPSPLLSVSRGDTLSVLGDNFVANATISIATDQGPLQLIRVSEDKEGSTWLLGSGVEGIMSARLTESTVDLPGYQTTQRASASIDTENGRQDGVAVQFAARTSAPGELEFTVVLGDTARMYRGNEIRDIDVEVYGAA